MKDNVTLPEILRRAAGVMVGLAIVIGLAWILGVPLKLPGPTLPILAPSVSEAKDVYDDFFDATPITTTCTSPATKTINARALCAENLASSTDAIFFRCDANPVASTRRGLEPGEKTCLDITLRNNMCQEFRYCADGGGVANLLLRWIQ